MPNDLDWITAAIKKAQERGATAPDAVWTQVEALLRGRLSEGQLSVLERERTARLLIERMAQAPSKAEEPQ